MVDSIGGKFWGIGEVKDGSRKRGQSKSSVKGRHLVKENETK
jgi:hypothetical protein